MILLIIPLGAAVARRHQREVPPAGQLGAPGAGGVRQDLPRLPHRAADDGDRRATTANPSPTSRSPRCATRRWRSPGSSIPTTTRPRCGRNAPSSTGPRRVPSVRVIQNGLENRNDAAEKIEELRAIQPPRGLTVSVGGTPALEQDSIHSLFDKLPLMVVAADHHHDDPDVPGVRIGGVADQGRGDECAHAWLDDGRADVDVRRRARLRPDELHPAAADGADDRPDHRGDLGPVDRLRGLPRLPHGRGHGNAACPPPRPSGSAPRRPAG